MLSMLEVINSTRLFTNFGATCWFHKSAFGSLGFERQAYCRCTTVEIIKILIQGIAVELYCYNFLNSRVCYTN